MSTQDAVESLRRLGLSKYEAGVFVALQQLGSGTAEAISDTSDVPRSQVYGAADDLAERGLVEVTQSTPKEYRPVSLTAAREQLTARIERERERAFENLDALQDEAAHDRRVQGVSTVRGRQPIDERIIALLETARDSAVFVAPAGSSLSPDIAASLRERATTGVNVVLVTAEPALGDRFDADPVHVIVMGEDNPADFAGRALMVDEATVLLAVARAEGGTEEEALWTAESSIGRILAQFMQSGMESGRQRQTDESSA
ncbi:helix-turn-helix domain-containing protein [Halorhabdus sp. BNX81]|uniref:TrmB family transcriptional regulator n=1 Tax=Halorhabdus sp. BNX81 TaxID=2980181 RepID=UPI0023DD1A72|nr:helix-turn-helix domain-containing protein [Halorhabdus sp. BNX81]WEL21536.1 Sugar-specific transcriptional regulator TrmB [Halorhabdus sp. BNX81]